MSGSTLGASDDDPLFSGDSVANGWYDGSSTGALTIGAFVNTETAGAAVGSEEDGEIIGATIGTAVGDAVTVPESHS